MGRVVTDSRRTRPGRWGPARWAPIAGVLALVMCGCSVAPMPIYDSSQAQPATLGSAAPVAANDYSNFKGIAELRR